MVGFFFERERESERERERARESEKNMESARDAGDENGFEKDDDEEEEDEENIREGGRGKITSFLRRSLTARFAKLLEKTEERVERLERKTEEQRKREEELTESFAEKFRNLVKHVNGKLGDIRGRVSFVGGGEGDGGSAAKPKGIDEDDGTNTRGGNDYGASGVAALNKKELEEGINRMVEQKVKEMLMEEDGALAPGLRALWEEMEKKEARELKKKLKELEQRARAKEIRAKKREMKRLQRELEDLEESDEGREERRKRKRQRREEEEEESKEQSEEEEEEEEEDDDSDNDSEAKDNSAEEVVHTDADEEDDLGGFIVPDEEVELQGRERLKPLDPSYRPDKIDKDWKQGVEANSGVGSLPGATHYAKTVDKIARYASTIEDATLNHLKTNRERVVPTRIESSEARKIEEAKRRRPTVLWSLKEVQALVAGVKMCGIGQWAAIKSLTDENISGTLLLRTNRDLHSKWYYLMQSAFSPVSLKTREGVTDIPESLLEEIRSLATAKEKETYATENASVEEKEKAQLQRQQRVQQQQLQQQQQRLQRQNQQRVLENFLAQHQQKKAEQAQQVYQQQQMWQQQQQMYQQQHQMYHHHQQKQQQQQQQQQQQVPPPTDYEQIQRQQQRQKHLETQYKALEVIKSELRKTPNAKYFLVQGKQQPKSKMLETAIRLLSRIRERVSKLKKEEYVALRNSHAKGFDALNAHHQKVLKDAIDNRANEQHIQVLKDVREKLTKELLDEARSKEEVHVAEFEKEKKRIHDEIAFFQSKLEKVQQDEKSNQRKKSEEMTREPTEVIELDSE